MKCLVFLQVDGERTQVYRLADAHGGGALSGTAEMAVKSSVSVFSYALASLEVTL